MDLPSPKPSEIAPIVREEIPIDDICDYAITSAPLVCDEPIHTHAQRKRRRFRLPLFRLLLMGIAISAIISELHLLCSCITSAIDSSLLSRLIYVRTTPPAPDSAPPQTQPLSPLHPLLNTHDSLSPSVTDDDLSDLIYGQEPIDVPDGSFPIIPADLSVDERYGLHASNETAYDIDLLSYLRRELPIPSLEDIQNQYGKDSPVVLIVHTHGTEAYAEDGIAHYSTVDSCRTKDTSKNVVSIGAVIADYFNENGIPTLHCTEMFDAESYINAYSYAGDAIKEFTAIYPSIKYVFDVHRDSIISADMTKLRPVTVINGTPTAQYMCVIGSDERAGTHTNWESNLTLACHLQAALWERSNSLTRRMSIRSASYNQRYAEGSLLLEIGSCGNTLAEAKACAVIVAEELAKIIKK